MLGGVAAGFARHLGVDVVWIRLAFVLATVFGGGVGIVVYLAAWLIVPEGDDADAGGARRVRTGDASDGRGAAFWVGVGLVAVGGLILLDTLLSPLTARITWMSPGDVVFPLVLIGIGALIFRSSRGDDVAPAVMRASGDGGFEERIERWSEEVEQRAEAFEARHEARAATLRELRSRSRVAPVTLGLALLTLGGAWLLGSLGVPGLTLARAFAGALLIIGIGLVAGAFLGRGRGLVAAGLLLTPVVLVATLVPQLPGGLSFVTIGEDGFTVQDDGPFLERPGSLAELPAAYEFGAGRTTIDLRSADLSEDLARAGTTELSIALGVGELRVLLPEDVTVELDVSLGVGEIALPGSDAGGLGLSRAVTLPGTEPEDGRLVLTIEQGIGAVTVTR
jgi:phage shock protein PspC (stress-responsive transcriptional regulator)